MEMTALADLIGQAPPLDPSTMQYRATPAKIWLARNDPKPERACQGCLFKGQKSKVCVQAGHVARMSGQPDCEERDTETDKTFIYQRIPIDERQLTLD